MDSAKKAQIEAQYETQGQSKAQVGALIFNKASTAVLADYSDYSSVFLAEYAVKRSEYTRISHYAIKLVQGKQPPFGLIYSLGQVELKILKTYIENNLANDFIWPSKSTARVSIFFN